MTVPIWNHYRAKDGRWLMLAMSQLGRHWPLVRKAMHEATGVTLEPDHISVEWIRMNAGVLVQLIKQMDELFLQHTADYWLDLFRRHDLLVEIVRDYGEIAKDPQVIANGMVATLPHPTLGELPIVAPPVNLSATPGTIRSAAPEYGQHTEEVLLEAGYTWEEIGALREQGVIGQR
jgi:crotonobetainyl-CoA:carnitine CoA-transferase CaiB-like acyl-CoA transferase